MSSLSDIFSSEVRGYGGLMWPAHCNVTTTDEPRYHPVPCQSQMVVE
jgi:hypothetical protein